MGPLQRTRLWRQWRCSWAAEGIDWRTAFDRLPRAVGQRRVDQWIRVADSCEVDHFQRAVV